MDKKAPRPVNVYSSPFMLSTTGEPIVLNVSDNQKIDIEIFAHLEYFSEIQQNGMSRLKGIKRKNGTLGNWRTFRSFIRQAKLFYFSAKTQDPSIGSLNYFYAFENLVKAYCCLHFPELLDNKISHGLSTGGVFSDNFNQEITLQKKGIMPIFYSLVTGNEITKDRKILNKSLVSYCTDISYEYGLAHSDSVRKNLPMKATLGGENTEKLSLLIAISAPLKTLEKYNDIYKVLSENFDWVDIDQRKVESAFKIPLDAYRAYNYFQSKESFGVVPTSLVSKDYYNKFFPFVSFYPRNIDELFNLCLPAEDIENKELILNECLSIYILMFYMSELVRYHPKTIQDNISKPSGWLMERFTVNTPQTFLRYMTNLISGEDFIFN